MLKIKPFCCLLLMTLFYCGGSYPAYGDLYWETEVITKGVPKGMPSNMPATLLEQFNKTMIVKNYLTPTASRTESKNTIMIIDYEAMAILHLNTEKKTYRKVDMKMLSENTAHLEKMPEVKFIPTGEAKNIEGYKCKKYTMTIMGTMSEFWLSTDVKELKEFKKLGTKLEKITKTNRVMKQMHAAGMSSIMNGFPVQTVMDMMGIKTTTTLKKIKKKKLSSNLFVIPQGYELMADHM